MPMGEDDGESLHRVDDTVLVAGAECTNLGELESFHGWNLGRWVVESCNRELEDLY